MKRSCQSFRNPASLLGVLVFMFGMASPALAGEEFRTNRGKVYHDCKVISHDEFGIMFRHRDGAARLAFSDLSSSVQKRYKYDPAAAEAFVKRHTPVPLRSSQIAHQRAIAKHSNVAAKRRSTQVERPRRNPNSYLQNHARNGNPIAPAMGVGHTRATNGGNPIAPAMMSYSQFQDARAQAARRAAPVRRAPAGGGRRK